MASVFARLRPCLRAFRTALLFRCGYLFQQVSEILTRCGLVHREAQRLCRVHILLPVVDEECLRGDDAAVGDHLAEDRFRGFQLAQFVGCLLYTSDAADEL